MTPPLFFGRCELRPDERQLLVDGQPAAIGSRALDILLILAAQRHRVVGKEELIEAVWSGMVVEENNLSVQISVLRKVLGRTAIATVSGRGYRLTAGLLPGPPTAPQPSWVGNLPKDLPPLYGRDADLDKLIAACAGSRLVSVCGTGGIGKTSLAVAAARQLAPAYPHGAWLVELASVREPALVVPSFAVALGISLPGHAPAQDELVAAMQAQHLLLVVDNCEHLLDAVADLVHALMRMAPEVRVIATSQESLRVPGEHVHRLAPLAVPRAGEVDKASNFGAVRLFMARVRDQLSDFNWTPADLADAAEICRRLDGIALAIELAAARVPHLGVAGVRERLNERLDLLTVGTRTHLRRHRTLRAALEWSHQLLSPESQVVLRRLGVFSGGFSLEGAKLVVGDTPDANSNVLRDLGLLVDRSLLSIDIGRRPRYRMLESMRVFALEQLELAGEAEQWKRRHAYAMRDICLLGSRERDSAWLWTEMSNARKALAWAIADADPASAEVAVTIATYTAVVLATSGPVPEAVNNLLRVHHLVGPDTHPALAAQYWQWLGRFGVEGRLPTSRCIEALERATAIFTTMGRMRHVHACRRMIAEAYMRAGDLRQAHTNLQAAAAVETHDGPAVDRMRRFRIASLLADAAGDPAGAARLVSQALEIAEAHQIERYCLMLIADTAWIELRLGEPDKAARRLRELLVRIEPSPREGLTRAYAMAGLIAALVAAGQLAEAREAAPRAVHALRACGLFLARGDIFAWLAAASGHVQLAGQLLGATDQFHARGETRRDRISQHARSQAQELVAQTLAPSEVGYWALQGSRTDEAVLAHALERAFADAAEAAVIEAPR